MSTGLKGLVDKVKGLASSHPKQADQAVEKAGDEVDQKTGGKYSSQVDTAEQKAEGYLGTQGNQASADAGADSQAAGAAETQATDTADSAATDAQSAATEQTDQQQ